MCRSYYYHAFSSYAADLSVPFQYPFRLIIILIDKPRFRPRAHLLRNAQGRVAELNPARQRLVQSTFRTIPIASAHNLDLRTTGLPFAPTQA